MDNTNHHFANLVSAKALSVVAALLSLVAVSPVSAFTLNVVGPDGAAITGNYRWLVEDDTTHPVDPGVSATDSLSFTFHNSHAPVVAKGDSTASGGTGTVTVGVPNSQRYFVSILPDSGYTIGGAPVAIGQNDVTVTVNPLPLPTAQISVFAFQDNQPINNAPDLPEEQGLAGFDVLVIDAAGRYGQPGGQIIQDAFGNPLGTTYNADGSVATLGNNIITTGADGTVLIKNLAPGKYGIQVVPKAGENWVQTSTIEGGKTVDAWVKAGEPPFFQEFGPPDHHVFIGFVQPMNNVSAPTGGSTITGRITNLHNSRPPDFAFFSGQPFPGCWIGLNSQHNGVGLYAQPCNDDSTFSIPNVPSQAADYELVIWDANLNIIISRVPVSVQPGGAPIVLGDIPVFNWFHRLEGSAFFDRNENGFRDCATVACDDPAVDDVPMSADSTAVNIRFRDGTVYQSFPVDTTGAAPFDEVFPFFHWLVAEVDFATLKATGVTYTVDAGGPVAAGEVLNPQPQCETVDPNTPACTGVNAPIVNPNTGDNLSTTLTGPVLTLGFQGFLGQTNTMEFGKAAYGPGENGGISGLVFYATTRAEDDPRYAAAEEWEPGIPRVQMALYQDSEPDGVIDDLDGNGVELADVDNHPLGNFPGPGGEDIDRNGNGSFDYGDAIQVGTTDSWDDSLPTGCQGDVFFVNGTSTDCFDGLRNFNQIREGVFDGGYAFDSRVSRDGTGSVVLDAGGNPVEIAGLLTGTYIVEASAPPGYEHLKEEDKNVDFGDEYQPAPLLLPPVCVNMDEDGGLGHLVPAELTLFPGVSAPFAGTRRPLCDRKQVTLNDGKNTAADFFMFTEVPKAARVVGVNLNDLANEFDPNAPTFGEKAAPPWLPVSFRDFTGKEISRVYTDEFGSYNALLPSTYTMNLPMASGVSPNMLTACLNSAAPIPNPNYNPADPNSSEFITDPFFNRQFSQFCYTFQYMPGTTTYLDTPVVPIAAFAGAGNFPVDCEFPGSTPMIHSVSGPAGGPYVAQTSPTGDTITIVSMGNVSVPNPAFDGTNASTIVRDYGFGAVPGSVTIGGMALTNVIWTADSITATVPPGATTGQLVVTRGDSGISTKTAVTVTVGPFDRTVHYVYPSAVPTATPIQNAIDTAQFGDLILVAPGTYNELVMMYKPVKLQGWGPGSVTINAINVPAEKLQTWRSDLTTLASTNKFGLLPGQEVGDLLGAEEGSGILVLGKDTAAWKNGTFAPRIDGMSISGAVQGGGILVNGFGHHVEISNNRLTGNSGTSGGGIRIGHPVLTNDLGGTLVYTDGKNDNIQIHHNQITQNGAISEFAGAGGGISIYTGSDNYRVTENFVCGNFSQSHGGGIGHQGLSNNGLIAQNSVLFNQTFNQGFSVDGGGITVMGAPGLTLFAGINAPLTPGSGDVTIDRNLVQGNQAGAGSGGGIAIVSANGEDVAASPTGSGQWYQIGIYNNMVVNNVAGYAGGGVALKDSARVKVVNNTVGNNDSTATTEQAFREELIDPNRSLAQPAGLVSFAHSAQLLGVMGAGAGAAFADFSNPRMVNNIIRNNRSFFWELVTDPGTGAETFGLVPDIGAGAAPVFNDLGVKGGTGVLNPRRCVLTDNTGYHNSNIVISNSPFVAEYFNADRGQTVIIPEPTTTPQTAVAFDEGGNMIDVHFGPLTITGDYHLQPGTRAEDSGWSGVITQFPELNIDFDSQPRPAGVRADIGADEVQ